MKYFTLQELTVTNTGLPNILTWEAVHNLETLVTKLLYPIREAWGKPIKVNSGFRCYEVNKAVGGAKNSEHLCVNGSAAADITAGSPEQNKKLFELILKSGLTYNQCIDEQDYTWIHISYNINKNRQQILHLNIKK